MPVSSGISELDKILDGGFHERRTTAIVGGPGSGKTMLGMQFLANGAGAGEPGLIVSFEESREQLIANFSGLAFPHAGEIGSGVEIIDGRPTADTTTIGHFDLTGLVAVLSAFVAEKGTKRIVIDALDVVFSLGMDRRLVQREVVRLLNWVADSGMTALLTLKASAAGVPDTLHFVEFAADGVVQLQSSMHGGLQQRALRVIKVRGASFVSGDHPYILGRRGIQLLYTPLRTQIALVESAERCSTGIERLDRMLEGGILRGSIALISGLPGTAKTTFGAKFLEEGCANGERGLFVGFDEPAEQMLSNVRSVGIDLGTHVASGALRIESFAAGGAIADGLLIIIETLIDEHQPTRIVIDPLSAWNKSGGSAISDIAVERLVASIKSRGLTAVVTAVSDPVSIGHESTETRVSTIADTWIHLSFAPRAGERNRTLTIVKSRGTGHSAQTRELVLGSGGMTLTDVFLGEGEVLFGTARYEQEQSARAKSSEKVRSVERLLYGIEEERLVLRAQAEEIKSSMVRIERRRSELIALTESNLQHDKDESLKLGSRRGVDPEARP